MGAIRHGTAPFPIGEVSTGSGNEKLLGLEVQSDDGKVYRLYKSNGAIADPSALCFQRLSQSGVAQHTVLLTAAVTHHCCGVAVLDQDALAAGDYFWLQVDGEMQVTIGVGVSVPTDYDFMQPCASGGGLGKVQGYGGDPGVVNEFLPLRKSGIDEDNPMRAFPMRKLWGY